MKKIIKIQQNFQNWVMNFSFHPLTISPSKWEEKALKVEYEKNSRAYVASERARW